MTTARSFGRSRLELVQGDITVETTDAIVNAANSSLMGGGGVDGAIHRAGGPQILEECRRIRQRQGPLAPGDAVATTGGRLGCRRVIHTVGPIWQGGGAGEAATLERCYRAGLSLAASEGLASIAFPSISTGVFGYPVDLAAEVALTAVSDVLRKGTTIDLVRFVLFGRNDLETYAARLLALSD